MIKPLRKRHLQVWSVLVLLIPAGILAGILARPKPATGELLQPAASVAQPLLLQEIKKRDYSIRLRGTAPQAPVQLEWVNTAVPDFPTAVIYQTQPGKTDITDAILIGRIEARGTYRFALPADSTGQYHFILYDFIKMQQIDSFDFSPLPKIGGAKL